PGLLGGGSRFFIPRSNQPEGPGSFQALAVPGGNPVHHANPDAVRESVWRQILDSRRRLVVDIVHTEPAPAGIVFRAHSLVGSRHYQSVEAFTCSDPDFCR